MRRTYLDQSDSEALNDDCENRYNSLETRLSSAEENDFSSLETRCASLEAWKNTPTGAANAALPTDLSTGLILGLLTSVAPAMNSTNNRVNAACARINVLENVFKTKGWLSS